MKKGLTGLVAVVVVAVVGAGVWYFAIRDDTPEKRTADCPPEGCAASTAETLDGTWSVVDDGSEAGLAITETLGSVVDHTAEGVVDGVTGTVVVVEDRVSDVEITVDMTTLEFTDSPEAFDVGNRAGAMQRTGLQTGDFPEATFVLSEPIDLPDDVTSGEATTVTATGDLTLHGETQPITFEVDITADGDRFTITPTEFVPVVLADHGITVDAPGFVADVADEGTFDFVVVLEQA